MNTKKSVWIWTAVLAVLIIGAGVLYAVFGDRFNLHNQLVTDQSGTSSQESDASGTQATLAPDFTVYDKAGGEVKLSDYFGKPIVLNFWSSNCGPCRMEMPHFDKLYKEEGEDVHVLMVNMTDGYWDTEKTAVDFIAEEGYSFPILFDTKQSAAYTYGITSLPTTLFINARGELIAHASGAIDEATLHRGLDMIR